MGQGGHGSGQGKAVAECGQVVLCGQRQAVAECGQVVLCGQRQAVADLSLDRAVMGVGGVLLLGLAGARAFAEDERHRVPCFLCFLM